MMSRLGITHQVVTETLCEALKTGMDGNEMMRFHDNLMNSGRNGGGGSMGSRSAGPGFGSGGSVPAVVLAVAVLAVAVLAVAVLAVAVAVADQNNRSQLP